MPDEVTLTQLGEPIEEEEGERERHPGSHDPSKGSILIESVDPTQCLAISGAITAQKELNIRMRHYVNGAPWNGMSYFGYTKRAQTLTFTGEGIQQIQDTLTKFQEAYKQKMEE